MFKKLFIQVLFVGATVAAAQASTDVQSMVDDFYQQHEPVSSTIYCRADIAAPECRTLIRFKHKLSGQMVSSFQMAFSAPLRQAAGTELFLTGICGNDECLLKRVVDTTVDGKMNGALEEVEQKVLISASKIVIKNIKFGTMIADLEFNDRESVLLGTNNGKAVNIVYPIRK